MEIIVGKTAGFCGGVRNSVTKALAFTKENQNVFCLGELVHNKTVVDNLKSYGLKNIDNLNDMKKGAKVILRAHGVAKEIYEEAKMKGIELYDLTCPKVIKVHELATDYKNNGYFIILIATPNHPETLGTISFCGENSAIVGSFEDIDESIIKLKNSQIKKVAIIAQTTFKVSLFEDICASLKEKLPDYELTIDNMICKATDIRQAETKKLASLVPCMIVIGGKNSSNTKKLYEISSKYCENTYLIETANELNDDFEKYDKIGIMAGASTPKESIDEVIYYLNKIKASN